MNNIEILELKFYCDDLDRELSIKEYLKELLTVLWRECECFSGKRPFGNGGWYLDLYVPLIKNKIIDGVLDDYGYIEECDKDKGEKIISECIKSL